MEADEAVAPAPASIKRPPRFLQQILLFLAVMGPGIITANVDNDAGGITTYSLAGAQFGYGLLWTLLPITVALIVVQEMSARMGVVTGKGLADLIRENFGVKATFWVMVCLLIADLGNTIAEFSGVAASLEIFGIPPAVSVPGAAVAVWLLVVQGTYAFVEKVFLVACTVYFTYIVSGFLAHPGWPEVLRATVTPSFEFRADYVTMLIAVVGTTIAPWMQFYLQSAVVEKGVRVEEYKASRLDVIVGCVITDVVAFFIIVCCAVTLHRSGIHVETAKEAALALAPLAGKWCSLLFAFGLFNASIFAATILPLATAYYVCEGFGWESGIDRKYGEAKQFYWLYTAIIVVGGGFVIIPHLPLLKIMLFSQVVNGVLLPFILIFMLVLINKPKLMGAHRNGPIFNSVAWGTTVVLIALTAYLVFQGAHDLIAGT
jgi:NRAMP (natural resistance-associated macrophage protein)-like metal ion transporter